MKRLAIITTHPIQYNAPLFRLLHERGIIAVKVFYTWEQSKDTVFDVRFGVERKWDIPLLEGYDYVFVPNLSRRPDSNRFLGVINPGLLNMLKKENFDAVLVYRWSLCSHLLVMQFFGGRPKLLFRGDSHFLSERSGLHKFLKRLLLRFVYRKTNLAFYTGSHNRDYYLQIGFASKQLLYTPHAVDNRRFSNRAAEWELQAMAERKRLGIAPDELVFLYAGKFYPFKNLTMLVAAFQQMGNTRCRLLLVGNGEQEADLKKLAATDSRILFLGFRNQSEMPLVYRLGDVFVLPSQRETWGLGVNEAMACSRAVIVSTMCGCAPELIVEGKTGFVFDATNRVALAATLARFENRQAALLMGHMALEHIANFSLERIAGVIEQAVTTDV